MTEADDMEMPTPCGICGEWFDLNDGNPCRRCRVVFCSECARDTGDGWRCMRCLPPEAQRRRRDKSAGRGSFGALILMRDDPADAPIPDRFVRGLSP